MRFSTSANIEYNISASLTGGVVSHFLQSQAIRYSFLFLFILAFNIHAMNNINHHNVLKMFLTLKPECS